MKNIITVYERSAIRFIPHNEYPAWQEKALQALDLLESGKGKGSDFLGWLHLPSETDPDIISQIKGICRDWKDIELAVVIGIGGSYLGAKAVIEALSHSFSALMPSSGPRIVFAGQNIGEDYLAELEDLMATKSVACVVISKSGTTTEPAIAFRLVKQHLLSRYGKEEAKRRIVAITDKSHGALRKMVNSEGFRSFIIPANVGGRFSVFTPVGLLPIALAGIDIEELLAGALEMEKITAQKTDRNPAINYAALRNALYNSGKKIELLVNYHPKLHYVTEWWKQLFGESEGKEHKGLFPAGVDFTTDLHSMGQYIQEGERHLFETVISVANPNRSTGIPRDDADADGLNYLAGKSINHCNKMAELGTCLAHADGGVPNLRIEMPCLNAYNLGALLYFFQKACGISGYVLEVNPFDQEGVEAYKKNMFALLDKPGFEVQGALLRERL
ncbi:MAG: glucose-6-phosphate isomerase [Bacteroidales bacterium]|jgi:glucose-6-phosphate isomerase|nr:glucose-6-phosphate isomerase [Bacteroidales bacterium]